MSISRTTFSSSTNSIRAGSSRVAASIAGNLLPNTQSPQQNRLGYYAFAMPHSARRLRLCVVSSVGGHLREVLELVPSFGQADVRFIVNDVVNVQLPGPVEQIAHAERDVRVLWNCVEAGRSFAKNRPDVLLSTGAGPIVPLASVGKLFGCHTIYIETFGSVDTPSLTGRLMTRLADRIYYQWPQLASYFPMGQYAGPIFVPPRTTAAKPNDDGSIFVAVGTSQRGFDRLLRWLDDLRQQGAVQIPIAAQRGHAHHIPRNYPSDPFLPSHQLEARIAQAKLVICHAGAGLLGTCIRHGKRPIVVPRLARFGEAINDHQLMLAKALSASGQALLVQEKRELLPAIQAALAAPTIDTPEAKPTLCDAIAADLRRMASSRGCTV